MTFTFEMMQQHEAEEIAYQWHYDGKYAFYDMEADQEDLAEFLDPHQRGDLYNVVKQEDELIGFFTFNPVSNDTIDIGLGMRPDLTGKGLGEKFLLAGLEFAKGDYQPTFITLSVATFNERAIKLYKRIGFHEVETYVQETNGGQYEFMKMRLRVK